MMRSGLWYSFGLVAGATLTVLAMTVGKREFFKTLVAVGSRGDTPKRR